GSRQHNKFLQRVFRHKVWLPLKGKFSDEDGERDDHAAQKPEQPPLNLRDILFEYFELPLDVLNLRGDPAAELGFVEAMVIVVVIVTAHSRKGYDPLAWQAGPAAQGGRSCQIEARFAQLSWDSDRSPRRGLH